jgi:predicted NBD/HSP70 family sugar kinase
MHLGLSIERTHIDTAVLLDGGDFVLHPKIQLESDCVGALLSAFRELRDRVCADGPVGAIGVVVEGGADSQSSPPERLACLREIDLKATLQAILNAPVTIGSPAQALGLFESRFGVARHSALSCFLYLDRHVSGSVTFGHRLWRGANRIVGNWGHMPLAWAVESENAERPCWCGRSGCLDSYVSSAGLERDYAEITGNHLAIDEIALAADAQDLVATSVLQILDDRLGRTTASIINMFDPETIVFGGTLSKLTRLYVNVPRKWPGYLFEKGTRTRLMRATQAELSLARGGACLVEDPIGTRHR